MEEFVSGQHTTRPAPLNNQEEHLVKRIKWYV